MTEVTAILGHLAKFYFNLKQAEKIRDDKVVLNKERKDNFIYLNIKKTITKISLLQ
jgi:hypothetical protein